MIEVREGMAKCDFFNIDDVEFIMICVLIKLVKRINLPLYCKIKCVTEDVIIISFMMFINILHNTCLYSIPVISCRIMTDMIHMCTSQISWVNKLSFTTYMY